jgi:hypothetical protein
MIKNVTAAVGSAAVETDDQRFARILLRNEFKPLKDLFDALGLAVPVLRMGVLATNCYQMFVGKIGHRLELVKQIHENACYARLGPKGGIRAVLPIHDTATYSTMVTLVNFDLSVTTTPNSVTFYDRQLADFKVQLMNKSGNA